MGFFKMKELLVLLGLISLGYGSLSVFLPHSQTYGYIMEQLFDLRSQIRDCRGDVICGIRSLNTQFKVDVTCVDKELICDGNRNCRSGADESSCPLNCHDLVRCKDMCTCARPCDGNRECPEGDDEDGCSPTCSCGAGNYLCDDGVTCIPRNQLCDGTMNCPQNDDEQGCAPNCRCLPGNFACSDGQSCINPGSICNNIPNECPNNEDEMNCPFQCSCQPGEFICAAGNKCIPRSNVCNDMANECCDDNAGVCQGILNEDNGPCPMGPTVG